MSKKKNNNIINLEKLNDKQKVWLTQLSYLNISEDGKKIIKNHTLAISKLDNYIVKPNAQMYGNILGDSIESLSKKIADTYIGRKDSLITKKQLLEELKSEGLGNLKIINIKNDKKTGFQATTFKDSLGNIGISYRGSDCEWKNGGLKDWIFADVGEFLLSNSIQVKKALEYFNQNKDKLGNNYLYGHSLGGNLTAHTYLQKYDEIKEAFSYNGLPISQKLLNTEEKIQAFNNKKFTCAVVAGDILQHVKEDNLYKEKVIFIKNNKIDKPSWLSAHLPQANSYDEFGNFITINREIAWKELGKKRQVVTKAAKNVNNIFGSITKKSEKIFRNKKDKENKSV